MAFLIFLKVWLEMISARHALSLRIAGMELWAGQGSLASPAHGGPDCPGVWPPLEKKGPSHRTNLGGEEEGTADAGLREPWLSVCESQKVRLLGRREQKQAGRADRASDPSAPSSSGSSGNALRCGVLGFP